MFEKILICLDGSNLAEQILPYATEQAQRFNSKVVLIQAFIVPSSTLVAEAQSTPIRSGDILHDELQRLETEANAYLGKVATALQEKRLEVSYVALQGKVGEVIVSYAQSESVDLIALATHGHSGLGRVIYGSIADYVLRNSGLPILIIRPS